MHLYNLSLTLDSSNRIGIGTSEENGTAFSYGTQTFGGGQW